MYTHVLQITPEMENANCDDLQQEYNALIDGHIMELRQLGMPEGEKAASQLLAVLNVDMFQKSTPFFEIIECLLVMLETVNRKRTVVIDKETLLKVGLSEFFSDELKHLGALSDLSDSYIYADNAKYLDAMDFARAQLTAIYILLGINRADILRAGMIVRRAHAHTKSEQAAHIEYVNGIPDLAVDNAYRKLLATELKVCIEKLDNASDMGRAVSLRQTTEAAIRKSLSSGLKQLERAEFTFTTACRVLDISIAPITDEEIRAQGFDALLGEWLQLDPIPNIVKHIQQKMTKSLDYKGALSVMRVMLDLGRHALGVPRATLLQVGLGLREKPEEEKKQSSIH